MKKLVMLFLCMGAVAFGQAESATAPAPAGTGAFDIGYGIGWDALFNDAFTQFLAGNGMTAIDSLRMWRTGWRMTSGYDWLYVSVESTEDSNFFFGTYGSLQRTRLAWASTGLTLGARLVSTDTVSWNLGGGVLVSRVLLQAYDPAGGSFATLYGTGGSISIVTDWNWSPVAETTLGIRVLHLASEDMSVWLKASVQAGWLPLDATWKLFGDPVVMGVPRPFDFFVRPALWLSVE